MHTFNKLRLRLRSLFQHDKLDDQLTDELAFHLEQQKAELIAQGLSEPEAELEARRLFGPVSPLREQCRDTRRTQWLEDFILDASHTLRSLRLSPTFALLAILTLALGIGANTAFFATAYGILFRPLPYPQPERIIEVTEGISGTGPILTLRSLARTADYAGYFPANPLNLEAGGQATRVNATTATYNLLRVLQVQPAIGRWFTEAEEQGGNNRFVVLSHHTWQTHFHSDSSILGRQIRLDEQPFHIIGVMPPEFQFPTPQTELWLPITNDPREIGSMWGSGNLFAIGRLRDNATPATAQAELAPIVDRILRLFPWRMPDAYGKGSTIVRHDEAQAKLVRPKLLVLSAAALLLLLIACGNVGNLLLARSVRREREFSLRAALGATSTRLLRQSITENLTLALLGGLAGLWIATILLKSLPLVLPENTPRMLEATSTTNLLIGSLASLCLTLLLFTVAPLLQRHSFTGRAITASRQASTASLLLIGLEITMATTLLIGAGLMGRTLWQLSLADAGATATNLVTANISAGPSRCPNPERCAALLQSLEQPLLASSVRQIHWASHVPLDKSFSGVASELEDHPRAPGEPAFVLWQTSVSPGYFDSLGIALRQGRAFNESDRPGAPLTTILSESTARRFWPRQSPIGKRIRPMSGGPWLTVVGVVADVQQYALSGFPAWVDGVHYRPLAQSFLGRQQSLQLAMFLEVPSASSTWPSLLRERFPDIVLSNIRTLGEVRAASIADQRSTATLLALFAILGLTLGIAGVYGVISHRAAQRTKEIGIRLALGATSSQLVRMVLSEAMWMAFAGTGIGVTLAYLLSRYLNTLVYGITIYDPLAFTVSPLALLFAAAAAAIIPALRATRTDPVTTLRND